MFCDKTGTLTENQMNLKKCSIRGALYDVVGSTLQDTQNVVLNYSSYCGLSAYISLSHFFYPLEFLQAIDANDADIVQNFLLCLALCQSAVPQVKENGGKRKLSL